jgi:hypothetical protein
MAVEAPKTAGITLAQLRASGRLVIVQCTECANRRYCRPSDLDLPMDTLVCSAGALLNWCDCGSTSVPAYPDSNLDAHKVRER